MTKANKCSAQWEAKVKKACETSMSVVPTDLYVCFFRSCRLMWMWADHVINGSSKWPRIICWCSLECLRNERKKTSKLFNRRQPPNRIVSYYKKFAFVQLSKIIFGHVLAVEYIVLALWKGRCFQLAPSEVFFSFGTSAYHRISLTHNNKQAIDVFSLPTMP